MPSVCMSASARWEQRTRERMKACRELIVEPNLYDIRK